MIKRVYLCIVRDSLLIFFKYLYLHVFLFCPRKTIFWNIYARIGDKCNKVEQSNKIAVHFVFIL